MLSGAQSGAAQDGLVNDITGNQISSLSFFPVTFLITYQGYWPEYLDPMEMGNGKWKCTACFEILLSYIEISGNY